MFFFALLPQGEGRFSFENRRDFLEENGEEFMSLQQSFTRLELGAGKPADRSPRKSSTLPDERRNCRCNSVS